MKKRFFLAAVFAAVMTMTPGTAPQARVASQAAVAGMALDHIVEVKRGGGGRGWGRSHNRGRHLGWSRGRHMGWGRGRGRD